jgi:hypothetical protein
MAHFNDSVTSDLSDGEIIWRFGIVDSIPKSSSEW